MRPARPSDPRSERKSLAALQSVLLTRTVRSSCSRHHNSAALAPGASSPEMLPGTTQTRRSSSRSIASSGTARSVSQRRTISSVRWRRGSAGSSASIEVSRSASSSGPYQLRSPNRAASCASERSRGDTSGRPRSSVPPTSKSTAPSSDRFLDGSRRRSQRRRLDRHQGEADSMKRWLRPITPIVAALIAVTACGGGAPNAGGSAAPSAAAEDKELVFYSGGDTNVQDLHVKQIIPAFEKATGIKVTFTFLEHGTGAQGIYDRIKAQKDTGKAQWDIDLWESDTGYYTRPDDLFLQGGASDIPNLAKVPKP